MKRMQRFGLAQSCHDQQHQDGLQPVGKRAQLFASKEKLLRKNLSPRSHEHGGHFCPSSAGGAGLCHSYVTARGSTVRLSGKSRWPRAHAPGSSSTAAQRAKGGGPSAPATPGGPERPASSSESPPPPPPSPLPAGLRAGLPASARTDAARSRAARQGRRLRFPLRCQLRGGIVRHYWRPQTPPPTTYWASRILGHVAISMVAARLFPLLLFCGPF